MTRSDIYLYNIEMHISVYPDISHFIIDGTATYKKQATCVFALILSHEDVMFIVSCIPGEIIQENPSFVQGQKY